MIKIAVPGANGRMGSVITQLIQESPNLEFVGATRRGRPDDFDVLIDFTSPEGTMVHLQQCLDNKAAIVIGTTGLTEHQFAAIQQAAKQIPILYSANMSVGVNVCYKLLASAAAMLENNWDVSIHDVHHQHKKDSPSGTAKQMAQVIAKNSDRSLEDVKILSERRGEFVGTHSVTFSNPMEDIIIIHMAKDRSIFAAGAITAAQWLYTQKPGLYTIEDLL